MDQPTPIGRPSSQAEGEERQRCGDGDRGAPGTHQSNDCRDAGRPRHEEETFRRLLVRADRLLIDSFELSDRICGSASREEDRNRAEGGEDHDGECGAKKRRATQHRRREQQPYRKELAEYRRVIEDEVEVDSVGRMKVHT